MPAYQSQLGVNAPGPDVLRLIIPSRDRQMAPVDQARWCREGLSLAKQCFQNASSMNAFGTKRDDDQGGRLISEDLVILQSFTSLDAIEAHSGQLHACILRMGNKTNQAAVGLLIGKGGRTTREYSQFHYLEVKFPSKGFQQESSGVAPEIKRIAENLGASVRGFDQFLAFAIPLQDASSDSWMQRATEFLARRFGGAIAWPSNDEGSCDIQSANRILFECLTMEKAIEEHIDALKDFLLEIGKALKLKSIKLVIEEKSIQLDIP